MFDLYVMLGIIWLIIVIVIFILCSYREERDELSYWYDEDEITYGIDDELKF